MNDKPRSVYLRGAEDGLVLGPVMCVAVVLVGMTMYLPWLFFPSCLVLLAVPVVVYIMLRRSYAEDRGTSTLSALWLHGICAFFFGGLIMALAAYVCMRWIKPTFITDQFRTVIDIYSSADNADAQELAKTLQRAMKARALPGPIDVALELLYGAVFTGSILSVIIALFVRRSGPKTPPPMSNQ